MGEPTLWERYVTGFARKEEPMTKLEEAKKTLTDALSACTRPNVEWEDIKTDPILYALEKRIRDAAEGRIEELEKQLAESRVDLGAMKREGVRLHRIEVDHGVIKVVAVYTTDAAAGILKAAIRITKERVS